MIINPQITFYHGKGKRDKSVKTVENIGEAQRTRFQNR